MQLRRQLIVLSLLTLVLPWSGLQYISEMEATLRDGQVRAMTAGAQAVAKLMASDSHYVAALTAHLSAPQNSTAQASTQLTHPVYAHPLMAAPIVDGYDDEWRYFPFVPAPMGAAGSAFHANVQFASFEQQFYGFIRVVDADLHYHNPSLDPAASGDSIELIGRDSQGRETRYIISVSAPGKAQVYVQNARGGFTQEHRLRAYWQEREDGYQVELQLPAKVFGEFLAIYVVDKAPGRREQRIGTQALNHPVPAIVRQRPVLSQLLTVFAANDQRLMVLSVDDWLLAEAGQYPGFDNEAQFDLDDTLDGRKGDQYGALSGTADTPPYQWLWRLLITRPHFLALQNPAITGRLEPAQWPALPITPQSSQPLNQQPNKHVSSNAVRSQWYQYRKQLVARVKVPIVLTQDLTDERGLKTQDAGQQIVGYVVAEQSAQDQDAGTANALWRLLRYSLLAVLVVGGALLGYATWLSWRVGRLSRAVDNALGERGAIERTLPENHSVDELGDLSRSFSSVLGRLQEYTDYLRSLSSKLSHELRTPLAVVKSSLDNLQHETDAQESEVYKARAQAGAERLSLILNAMSAASRVEESLAHAEPELVELDQLLSELSVAYSDSFARPIGVELVEGEFSLRAVPDLLVQLLDKLVDNAVDFCPAEGKISLSLARTSTHHIIQVSNDGPLLPQAMQVQLFDSLVSIRPPADLQAGTPSGTATQSKKPHLGLGLHIARLIVEYHGGDIRAENRADLSGVIFSVELPIR